MRSKAPFTKSKAKSKRRPANSRTILTYRPKATPKKTPAKLRKRSDRSKKCSRRPPDHGRTSPLPRGAAVAALAVPRFRYPQKQFAERPGGNQSDNQHIGSFLPSLFGWFAPPKFTRV